MTRQQTLQLLEILYGAYGGLPESEELIESYKHAWDRNTFTEIQEAVLRYVRYEDKKPTPAGVLKFVTKRPTSEVADAEFTQMLASKLSAKGLVFVPERHPKGVTYSVARREDVVPTGRKWRLNGVQLEVFERKTY